MQPLQSIFGSAADQSDDDWLGEQITVTTPSADGSTCTSPPDVRTSMTFLFRGEADVCDSFGSLLPPAAAEGKVSFDSARRACVVEATLSYPECYRESINEFIRYDGQEPDVGDICRSLEQAVRGLAKQECEYLRQPADHMAPYKPTIDVHYRLRGGSVLPRGAMTPALATSEEMANSDYMMTSPVAIDEISCTAARCLSANPSPARMRVMMLRVRYTAQLLHGFLSPGSPRDKWAMSAEDLGRTMEFVLNCHVNDVREAIADRLDKQIDTRSQFRPRFSAYNFGFDVLMPRKAFRVALNKLCRTRDVAMLSRVTSVLPRGAGARIYGDRLDQQRVMCFVAVHLTSQGRYPERPVLSSYKAELEFDMALTKHGARINDVFRALQQLAFDRAPILGGRATIAGVAEQNAAFDLSCGMSQHGGPMRPGLPPEKATLIFELDGLVKTIQDTIDGAPADVVFNNVEFEKFMVCVASDVAFEIYSTVEKYI